MDQKQSAPSIQDDVLHSTGHSKLTPEEIAKAVEHHNRHHPKEKLETAGTGKNAAKKKGK
jgi:hypothetical protein